MKVKELGLTANIAWSPATLDHCYLACGTAAQQLDASFNSNSTLQIYNLNLEEQTLDMKLASSITFPAKFHSLLWGVSGLSTGSTSSGLIVGGCENSAIYMHDASKLLAGQGESLVASTEGKHSGPVFSLSFNPFQPNLLASGSSDCEISIWDLNDPTSAMSPGAKATTNSDVTCVEWNRQVQHILASTYGGRCVVWDLKKSSSIIQISDSVSRIKARSISWHPNVATQMILASDDDATPVAQIWDLRYASAPLKTLEGHTRGILATSWCEKDQDLFITSSKDNKTLVWNPNNNDNKTGEIVGEFPSYNQWCFDVDWCKRDPTLIATSTVDGSVSVLSVMGGGLLPAQSNKFSAIADSFPDMEIPAALPQVAQPTSIHLKRPPKWFKKPAGANFSFGGRLVSWNSDSVSVQFSQVVTEPELVQRSMKLEEALSQTHLAPYCYEKMASSSVSSNQAMWQFISAALDQTPRQQYMHLLGYSPTQVSAKMGPQFSETSTDTLADHIGKLGANDGSNSSLDPSEQFEMIASAQSFDKTPESETDELEHEASPLNLDVGDDSKGLIVQALLVGDIQSAVDLCLRDTQYAHALVLASHIGAEVFAKTSEVVLRRVGGGLASLVSAVVKRDLSTLINSCPLNSWKGALVAALTYANEVELPVLAERLGERLERDGNVQNLNSAMLCYICAGSLEKFVSCWVKINDNSNQPSTLQDLVEVISVLQRALSAVGRSFDVSDGTAVSSHLCLYASMLAAQGALSTAVSYLSSAAQGEMLLLKNRLNRALGYTSAQAVTNLSSSRSGSISGPSQQSMDYRRSSTTHYHQSQAAPFAPSIQDQQRIMFETMQQNQQQPFYNPAPTAPVAQDLMSRPVKMTPIYGDGPPVNFAPSYSAPTSMMTPVVSPQIPPSNAGGMRRAGRYVADPNRLLQSNPTFPNLNPTPIASHHPSNMAHPIGPMGTISQGMFVPESPQQQAVNSKPAKMPAAFDSSVPRGWNDPPPVSGSRKAKLLQQQQQQQQQQHPQQQMDEPITCPMAGGFNQEPSTQQFMGFQQSNPHETADPQMRGSGQLSGGISNAPPEPVSKAPLPQEHQILQDVITNLHNHCLANVTNQQIRVRLNDIGQKMEILYDKIRAGQLGGITLGGLHNMVSKIQIGDYPSAIAIHGQTIAAGNFAEMSQFMTQLKMLFQLSMQHQVYL